VARNPIGRQSAACLVQALDLTGEEQVAFQAAGKASPRQRRPGSVSEHALDVHATLPAALTSFIGREGEKDEIERLLVSARLVTLTGVGGCGKTRLALEVAKLVHDRYPYGVRLVELASLADPFLVPQAVATALGIREVPTQPLLTTIVAAIGGRRLLLLLDNCEHLLDSCAHLVDTLLRACPELQVLVTSREAFGLAGEVTRRVPSLPVPPLEPTPGAEQLCGYAAVQLFLDRVRHHSPDFAVTSRNADAIAQVCGRLDGIPLALELAAALVRSLAVEDIAVRLDRRLCLLTSGSRAALPRQQTLRTTIDWSYDLLSSAERGLFSRLSVFWGRWTLESAENVCSGDGIPSEQVVELLSRLLDKSLVLLSRTPLEATATGCWIRCASMAVSGCSNAVN
jgi:predicted ATPase